jgi:prefoldin subunit 5
MENQNTENQNTVTIAEAIQILDEAIQSLGRAVVDLQARVGQIETSFTEIAGQMHAVTEATRERLNGLPRQKPSRLN